MAVSSFTKTGIKSTTPIKLDKEVFEIIPDNHELLKNTYLSYLANKRQNSAQSKTRGLIRGGGIKPRPQKGTGRSRAGSIRSPLWRGGGVVFGPTGNENYTIRINKNAKVLALKQALSLAVKANKLVVIEDIIFKRPKTKEAVSLFSKLGVSKNILVVVENKIEAITRPLNNIQGIKVRQANYVNVFDTLNADYIVITKSALDLVTNKLKGDKL